MKNDFIFISESVTEGHPDKLCDVISDAIVDEFLRQDPCSRITAECALSKGIGFIAARFASDAVVDVGGLARTVIREVGYDAGEFNATDCTLMTSLSQHDTRARFNVDDAHISDHDVEHLPAQNQVTVFGFACTQTPALMPLPIWLANRLARRLTAARLLRELSYLSPDGKIQVGIEYRGRKPSRVHSITIIAGQHEAATPAAKTLKHDLMEQVINPVFAQEEIAPDDKTRIFFNPDGPLVGGGPAVHSGLTGRKTAIDTYGEYARHSGAALSGKDPMRIDRVGAYAARYAAKNVVAAGLADECEVLLSYTIGLTRPVSVQVETFDTGRVDDAEITARLLAEFDFRLGAIVRRFHLRQMSGKVKSGFYKKLAAYGQMGRMDLALPWEATDKAQALR